MSDQRVEIVVSSASARKGRRKRTDDRQASMRQRNTDKLLKAAESVFAKRGFDGATTGEIARKAGVSKPTLHYYFRTKEDIYTSVLNRILGVWVDALDEIQPDAEPVEALGRYIARKIEYSRKFPELTRLWAMEVLTGARHVKPFLRTRVRRLVDSKGAIIKQWMTAGKMDVVDPSHLLFQIWASTQTYAESEFQIEIILGADSLDDRVIHTATQTAEHIFLIGLGLVG
jgi:TetR/AcrR family transcriptional regulator